MPGLPHGRPMMLTEGSVAASLDAGRGHGSSSRDDGAPPHLHADVREAAFVIAASRSALQELYRTLRDWPGLRIVHWEEAERRTLTIAPRRTNSQETAEESYGRDERGRRT